jgi:hypothetical protein
MAPEDMASAKRTTKVLRNPNNRTVAYARKQKPSDGDASATEGDAEPASPDDSADRSDVAQDATPPAFTDASTPAPDASAGAPEAQAAAPVAAPAPATPATPAPSPDEPPLRARNETIRMPVQAVIGAPPAMPTDTAPPPAAVNVDRPEDPTRMPGPREIPGGKPEDPAAPPGVVPSGDSRSLRRRTDVHEFALIYRVQTYVISRFGVVGTRGQWRVVEYPTSGAAGHAYAKECSRFVSDGFSDYREWSGI